jgi:hypothetical protein
MACLMVEHAASRLLRLQARGVHRDDTVGVRLACFR